MSLSEAQKDFIKASVQHLITFPNEADPFKAEVTKLLDALNNEVPDTHEYFQLKACLLDPKAKLLRLDDQNARNATTTADVLEYIIDLIDEAINASANQLHISLAELVWNKDLMKTKFITDAHKTEVFISQIAPEAHIPLPWERIHEETQIFSAALVVEEESVRLNIKIEIPGTAPIELSLDDYKELPDDLDDERVFMMGLISDAYKAALDFAFEAIMDHLETKKIETSYILSQLKNNPAAKFLLVDQFYLNEILNKKTVLLYVYDDASSILNVYLNEAVKNLLKHCPEYYSAVKTLSEDQLKVLSKYSKFFNNKSLDFYTLLTINKNVLPLLLHPLIINLVHQGVLTFTFARRLPSCLIELFNSELFMDYKIFSRPDFNWDTIATISPESCAFLLDKNVAELIRNNAMRISEADLLTETERTLIKLCLKFPNIKEILLTQKISLQQLLHLTSDSLKRLTTHPYLSAWLKLNLIDGRDLERDFITLLKKVYTQRLYAICLQTPFVLTEQPKPINDSFEHILMELETISKYEAVDLKSLQFILSVAYCNFFIHKLNSNLMEEKPIEFLTRLLVAGKTLDLPPLEKGRFRFFDVIPKGSSAQNEQHEPNMSNRAASG